jgi:MFS family permease
MSGLEPEPPEFNLRGSAVAIFGPAVLFGLAEGAILPVIVLTARDHGATVAGAALVLALLAVGSLLMNLPASVIAEKLGERWAIAAASILACGALALSAVAPNLALFGLGIFIFGMTGSVIKLARQKLLAEAVPPTMRARAMSMLGGSMRIGVFAGPFLGALVIQLLGLMGAYYAASAAMLTAGVISLSLVQPARQSGEKEVAQPAATGFRAVLSHHRRVFLSFGSAVALLSAVRAARQAVIPLWAESLGIDPTAASLIYGLSGAVDMLLFYPGGKAMDRFGRRHVAVPSTIILALGLAAVPFTPGPVSLGIVAGLLGLGNGIGSGLIMTLGADLSPAHGRAHFLGIWRLINDLGSTAGPAAISGGTAVLSLAVGIWASSGMGIASAALFILLLPKRPHGPTT